MKIRSGFVSNSSSSSFVMMVEAKAHRKALAQLKDHPQFEILKKIADAMEESTESFMGYDLVVYEDTNCHGEHWVCGVGCSYDAEEGIFNEDGEIEVFSEYLAFIPPEKRIDYTDS
jgi:hypothetical protein